MNDPGLPTSIAGQAVVISCPDGVELSGHLWRAAGGVACGGVIINAATGVLARYYHRYARFLAAHGFDVLTYDYRGIGASAPQSLKTCRYRWRDWGEIDFDAALRFMGARRQAAYPIVVVGHSIGGFLPGLAESAPLIDRMLTVGAQYAWRGDYAPRKLLALLFKWHFIMPIITAICGYFPGRKLGWLENLPSGVANEWSFRAARFERSHPPGQRATVLKRMAAVRAPILAVAISDDELGTLPAIRRALGYYANAPSTVVQLKPSDYNLEAIGHFHLFHDSHAPGFWMDTLRWLKCGHNPWPQGVLP
jgi:predicted alpha/beta hydrolase